MLVDKKVIVVTGAGSGIGKALVLELLSRGSKVAAADLREEALEELKKAVGRKNDQLSTHVLDVSDKETVEALPAAVVKSHGAVDGIINNAGIIQPFVRVADLEYGTIEKVMNVNFWGTLYMTKAFLPHLLSRPKAHITNISSMGGFLPVPGQSVYGASKAAVKLLTEGLYAELKDTNVGVTVIFPGATATNITENSGVKAPAMPKSDGKEKSFPTLTPEAAARIIVDGIEKNKVQVFTGKDSKLMNNLYRLSPLRATNLIAKQMKSLLPK